MSGHFNQNQIEKDLKKLANRFKFRTMLRFALPMGYLSRMQIKEMNENTCTVSVPFNYRNKNPFKSTFWAVLGMAAEMASGAFIVLYTKNCKHKISAIIVNQEAEFVKKAKDLTTFTFSEGQTIKNAVIASIATKEAREVKCYAEGKNEAGEIVAKFWFTWSLKAI